MIVQRQLSNPDDKGKLDRYPTIAKHNKARAMNIITAM